MAQFIIETTKEEQDKVIEVLKQLEGKTVPVSTIAEMAGMRDSRVRYVIIDLISAGKIERIPTKAFSKHYMRYTYKVL